MKTILEKILKLSDQKGNFIGVFIPYELWIQIEPVISEKTQNMFKVATDELPEPMDEWETLVANWDFRYPVSKALHCDLCGARTEDWINDNPRLFKLRSANLGGFTAFKCLTCKARVLKKHFKDHMNIQCIPFLEEK